MARVGGFSEENFLRQLAPFTHGAFDRVSGKNLESFPDIHHLPFTVKDNLRSDVNYPYGLPTVGREKPVRLHSASGTNGRSTAVFHTRRDLGALYREATGIARAVALHKAIAFHLAQD